MPMENKFEGSVLKLEDKYFKVKSQHRQLVQERIHAQVEHSAIQSFEESTKLSIHDANLQRKIQEFEMLGEKQNIAIETKAYQDKVKQLYSCHKLQLQDTKNKTKESLQLKRYFDDEMLLKVEQRKKSLLNQLRERQVVYIEEIRQMKLQYDDDLERQQSTINVNLEHLRRNCSEYVKKVKDDLCSKRSVKIRETEEQGNGHIFELEMRHSTSNNKTMAYYDSVSKENIITSKKLDDNLNKLKNKGSQYQTEITMIGELNEELREPVERSLAKVRKKLENSHVQRNLRIVRIVLCLQF